VQIVFMILSIIVVILYYMITIAQFIGKWLMLHFLLWLFEIVWIVIILSEIATISFLRIKFRLNGIKFITILRRNLLKLLIV